MQLCSPGCNRFENVEAISEIRAVEARQETQHIGIIMQHAFLILSRLLCVYWQQDCTWVFNITPCRGVQILYTRPAKSAATLKPIKERIAECTVRTQ